MNDEKRANYAKTIASQARENLQNIKQMHRYLDGQERSSQNMYCDSNIASRVSHMHTHSCSQKLQQRILKILENVTPKEESVKSLTAESHKTLDLYKQEKAKLINNHQALQAVEN